MRWFTPEAPKYYTFQERQRFKENAQYYIESEVGYRICKANGRYAASDSNRNFIGIFDTSQLAKRACSIHYKENKRNDSGDRVALSR